MSQTKDIRASVEGELNFDPLVDASEITVKNLIDAAWMAPGVYDVDDRLSITG